jgi:hypothetical protein
VAGHPIFGQGGGSSRSRVDNHPHGLWGWSDYPQKAKKQKQKGLDFGVTDHPPLQMPWGWFIHPQVDHGVVAPTTPMAFGVARPPLKSQKKKKKKKKKKKEGVGFEGGRTTPKGLRVVSATLAADMGVVRPPPDRPWGSSNHSFGQKWGGGGWSQPFDFSF